MSASTAVVRHQELRALSYLSDAAGSVDAYEPGFSASLGSTEYEPEVFAYGREPVWSSDEPSFPLRVAFISDSKSEREITARWSQFVRFFRNKLMLSWVTTVAPRVDFDVSSVLPYFRLRSEAVLTGGEMVVESDLPAWQAASTDTEEDVFVLALPKRRYAVSVHVVAVRRGEPVIDFDELAYDGPSTES